MTALTRPVRRETTAALFECGRSRPVIVSIEPGAEPLIGFRLKGTHRTYFLRPADCYRRAVYLHVQQQKAEEKARKAQKT